MRKCNETNERIKRRYFHFLKEAKRQSQASVDKVAAALVRFETSTAFKSFKEFHIEQAVAFKRGLEASVNPETGRPLSKATISSTLRAVKAFFLWLAGQPGYRARLSYSDAEYFNLSAAHERIAQAHGEKPTPTLPQIQHAFRQMPAATAMQRRDHALFAFILLTGARDGAVASLKLKHVDLIEGAVHFDAREVKTKHAKSFRTWFFPVPDAFRACVTAWIGYLREERLFGNDDPLFPRTKVAAVRGKGFQAVGLDRQHWSNAGPIRRVFRDAFARAGLPVFGPHSFRRTLALLGEECCRNPEEFKAWSQNLGHDDVLTTFNSYGTVQARRQAEIMRALARPAANGAPGTLTL